MFSLKKTLATATAAVLVSTAPVAVMAQDAPGEGTTVNMAQATWDTGWFHAEIYRQLLQELGYDVPQITTLDNPPFYQAVSQGDMDLWVNGWFPLHNTYEDTFSQGAELVGAVAEGGALEGYLVNASAIEEFDITSLEDFKRDEVKEAFDRNGDGMADLVACPPGWGCEINIEHHMDAYDLRDHINPIKAGYAASMADAATMEGVEGCIADPCTLGFPANDINPVANTAFLDENPAVRALLEEVEIPLADIFAQNAAMNNGEDDIEAQAATWIEDNRDMVDGWLETARSSAS